MNTHYDIRSLIKQELCLFQVCEFENEFFLAEAGKADSEFCIIAAALASEHQPLAVFCVADVCTRNDRLVFINLGAAFSDVFRCKGAKLVET